MGILEQIAYGTGPYRREHSILVQETCQHQDPGTGELGPYRGQGGDAI